MTQFDNTRHYSGIHMTCDKNYAMSTNTLSLIKHVKNLSLIKTKKNVDCLRAINMLMLIRFIHLSNINIII